MSFAALLFQIWRSVRKDPYAGHRFCISQAGAQSSSMLPIRNRIYLRAPAKFLLGSRCIPVLPPSPSNSFLLPLPADRPLHEHSLRKNGDCFRLLHGRSERGIKRPPPPRSAELPQFRSILRKKALCSSRIQQIPSSLIFLICKERPCSPHRPVPFPSLVLCQNRDCKHFPLLRCALLMDPYEKKPPVTMVVRQQQIAVVQCSRYERAVQAVHNGACKPFSAAVDHYHEQCQKQEYQQHSFDQSGQKPQHTVRSVEKPPVLSFPQAGCTRIRIRMLHPTVMAARKLMSVTIVVVSS